MRSESCGRKNRLAADSVVISRLISKWARTIDKVNEDAKEHGIYPDKNTEDKIQTAMNEVFADNLPLKMRKLTFGVNLGILKFSLETTRESKE